ncbi:hypothetical protein B0H15DRAFT_803825 [Mycena belliarum]|uniref:Uncharacterized protein n=1 Tax=Mycena belliarum TaxID=1033014 RepID=A0AAD6XQK0_9AGAR|nr:hypothetical protein B0H15DRAFT_803825 [Mycena belliae]
MPAVQTNTPQAAAIIKELLQILYRLIMPLYISWFEWDMLEFVGRENNVVAFGRLEPSPTSCQANSSSAANEVDIPDIPANPSSPNLPLPDIPSLRRRPPIHPEHQKALNRTDLCQRSLAQTPKPSRSIGGQGKAHGNFKDDPIAFTLFVLLLRLAPGSDLGLFLWLRGGIYLQELNVYILFTSFKGQDIHMGSAPTFVRGIQKVRCGYVLYPSMAATARTTQLLYSPSLHFLHSPPPNIRDAARRYYSTHGDMVLGNNRAQANRLGLEGILALKNYLSQYKLNLGLDVNALLQYSITYIDDNGGTSTLEPTPLDVEDDEAYQMICLIQYPNNYFWWCAVMAEYSLGLTKPMFKAQQNTIREAEAGHRAEHQKGFTTEHCLLPKLVLVVPQLSSGPFLLISKILILCC